MDQDIQKQLEELRQRALSEVKQNKKKLNKGTGKKKEVLPAGPAKAESEAPQPEPVQKKKEDVSVLIKKEDPSETKEVSVLNKRPDDGFEDEPVITPEEAPVSKPASEPVEPKNILEPKKETVQQPAEPETKKEDPGSEEAAAPARQEDPVRLEETPAVQIAPAKEHQKGKTRTGPRHKGPHVVTKRKVVYLDKEGNELSTFTLRSSDGKLIKLTAENSVGKDPASDIILSSRYCSRVHARIFEENDVFYLEDKGSTNGTFIGGKKISSRVRLIPGERIVFGDEAWTFDVEGSSAPAAAGSRSEAPIALVRKDTGEVYGIFSGMIIGRLPSCDISIPEPEGHFVSGKHAEITIDKNDIRLKDLNSSNGTFVGNSRIKSKTLYKGNIVKFADVEFEVIDA